MTIATRTKEPLPQIDNIIVRSIGAITKQNEAHWDFKTTSKELKDQSLYQYPAMMVVALQRQLMSLIQKHQPTLKTVADPFVGSGSILTASLFLDLDFVGQDINPLAILLCKAKAMCRDVNVLTASVARCTQAAREDSSSSVDVTFFNQVKWFTLSASIALSRLRRSIRNEPVLESRLFLWVCLAETARNVSNSRTSTFKLHIRPAKERNATEQKVRDTFEKVCGANLLKLTEFVASLPEGDLDEKKKLDDDGCVLPILSLGDSTKSLPPPSHTNVPKEAYDLVVTSPPYGDNITTVPYGQAAWLPLQWIDSCDIHPLATVDRDDAYSVDRSSVGGTGSKRKWQDELKELKLISPTVTKTAKKLKNLPPDGLRRFTCFIADIKKVIDNVATACNPNAYLIWTLGHRRIRGVECPLTEVVSELFNQVGVKEVHRITRSIQSKRMPSRNQISTTIKEEYILILRKQASTGKR